MRGRGGGEGGDESVVERRLEEVYPGRLDHYRIVGHYRHQSQLRSRPQVLHEIASGVSNSKTLQGERHILGTIRTVEDGDGE